MSYQVVLQLPGDSLANYLGMIVLEIRLTRALGDLADVDGHDFGKGERNIFIITDEPQEAFRQARPVLERGGYLSSLRAAYRHADRDDYIVIWPEHFIGEFTMS